MLKSWKANNIHRVKFTLWPKTHFYFSFQFFFLHVYVCLFHSRQIEPRNVNELKYETKRIWFGFFSSFHRFIHIWIAFIRRIMVHHYDYKAWKRWCWTCRAKSSLMNYQEFKWNSIFLKSSTFLKNRNINVLRVLLFEVNKLFTEKKYLPVNLKYFLWTSTCVLNSPLIFSISING